MERNIAVLIDFENIAAGAEKEGLGRFNVDAILSRVKDKGRILLSRSYADWGRFARFKQGLLAANVHMYELTSHGMQDKNRADIAMVVDCLDLAYTKSYIDTYVVVSGDSDFTPMILKLRELDKYVIGVGTRRSTSRLIINACDEFIFYDSIARKAAKPRRKKPSKSGNKAVGEAFELLVDVLEGMQREDPTAPHAGVLKSAMLRRRPDFTEGDLGFASFGRFLEAARDNGDVKLTRDQKAGGYLVDSVEDDGDSDSPKSAPAKASAKGTFVDDQISEAAEPYAAQLRAGGDVPLAHPTRMALLEALVDRTEERRSKKRRTTIPFMAEDVKKTLRNTCPDLPIAEIKTILGGLMDAGCLMHKDGSPIRSATASFHLEKDAEALNKAVAQDQLKKLKAGGADLGKTDVLADFFFGSGERSRDVEEIVAWIQVEPADESLDELFDLGDESGEVVADDAEATPAKKPAAKKAPAKKTTAKKAPAKKTTAKKAPAKKAADTEAAEAPEADAAEAPAEAPAAKKAPAKKTTTRKTTAKKTTTRKSTAKATEDEAEAAPVKKTTTRKTTAKKPAAKKAPAKKTTAKKPAPKVADAADTSLDDALEIED